MEHKGWLTADGRVVQSKRADVIGNVGYRETRYNLRRVYVHREWVVRLYDGRTTTGPTRRLAVADAVNLYQRTNRGD